MQRAHRKPHFRNATLRDLPALLDIERTCFGSYYRTHRFNEKQFRYYLKLPAAITQVAVQDDRPVGYVLGVVQHGRLRDTARLYSLAVREQARDGGIGERLLRGFMQRARARGARRVRLEVAVRNAAAQHLFERAGFRCIGELPSYYAAGIDALLMIRTLI